MDDSNAWMFAAEALVLGLLLVGEPVSVGVTEEEADGMELWWRQRCRWEVRKT